ncbi:thiamine pyrophosphate-dependent enzyme [Desulfoferula mesophila]|uniref:Indolepyruvate oxidoreductase subunit IorA n=1 Tax=Desulfoferula mesophila TaxID=3058419 RepID=A0AAU9EK89_9BACT|nr:indolepyruvate oxidoreductase [Desulfoferula mesophilus]
MSEQKTKTAETQKVFLLGNEALVRGALEAGVDYASAYPGTPSSEIIERLSHEAKKRGIHVEWSSNEKVACEGAGAAAVAGLGSLAAMKNAGLAVALDFLTHCSLTGLGDQGGSMVVVVCDDPDAHSSGDETDSRWQARFAYAPMLEPTNVAEAREMIRYCFDLSREYDCYVFLRSYTRLSHGSSIVELGPLPEAKKGQAHPDCSAAVNPYLGKVHHVMALERLAKIKEVFETSKFNEYFGPEDAELLVIASGNGVSCGREALEMLGLEDQVGLLKLATLWPFPTELVRARAKQAKQILVLEEVDPVVEVLVKDALNGTEAASVPVLGKESGHVPMAGEITPDRALDALGKLTGKTHQGPGEAYQAKLKQITDEMLISRGLTWCPGCPHRASFWALDKAVKAEGGEVYVTGDIGCYTLDVFPEGKCQMNMLHAMGSSIGLASGLGQMHKFGWDKPVVSICGDSTFYHAVLPGLVSAIYNQANLVHVVLDNSATAMTGFQAHAGVGYNAMGEAAPKIDVVKLCEALGVPVTVADPFDIRGATKALRGVMAEGQGVRILVLRRACELVRMKADKNKPYKVVVNQDKCKGEECGTCYSKFRCPALLKDPVTGKASIREDACPGCGACASVCPFKAIEIQEVAK